MLRTFKSHLRKANLHLLLSFLIEQLTPISTSPGRGNMSKSVRAASIFLLCFCVALIGCGGSATTSSSNPTPPGNGNNSGGNGGGSGTGTPSNASETLYESFSDFTNSTSSIRAFKIDSNNGTLSQLPGFPVSGPFQSL